MSKSRFVEQLQQKPEPVRRRVLAITLFSAMLIILGVWFMRFSLPKDRAAREQSPGPFATLRAPLHNLQEQLRAVINTFRTQK
ncbi:MAG: hypothetical protein HYU35_00780 [Parcubacteria group bacterium]|nr:hypothetical protein [Parcubacteria group bacterium]